MPSILYAKKYCASFVRKWQLLHNSPLCVGVLRPISYISSLGSSMSPQSREVYNKMVQNA